MDKWLFLHKKTLKRIVFIISIIICLFYIVLVIDVNYLFKKNYGSIEYKDERCNVPFEYRGLLLMFTGFRVLTADQAVEIYGDDTLRMVDGIEFELEPLDKDHLYVEIDYDYKKLSEDFRWDLTDLYLCSKIKGCQINGEFHELMITDGGIDPHKLEVGESVKGRRIGFMIDYDYDKYKDDPDDSGLELILPGYKGQEYVTRLVLKESDRLE